MKMSDFLNRYSGLLWERSANRVITVLLVVTCLVLAQVAVNKKPVVILVPQNLQGQGKISTNTASAKIKEAWGLTAANLVGNVTPGNVDFVEQAIDSLLSPQLYHDMLLDIHEQAESIREGNITLSFVPTGAYFQASKNIVFVTGETTRSSRFAEPVHGRRTFEFEIEVSDYRPRIVNWKNYEGGPRINYNRTPEQKTGTEKIIPMTDLEAVAEVEDANAENRRKDIEKKQMLSTASDTAFQEPEVIQQHKEHKDDNEESVNASLIVEKKLKEIL